MAESELDKHTSLVTDLTRKVDELQVKADQAGQLKDQVDEYVCWLSRRSALIIVTGIDMRQTSCKRLKM
jgi:hypothetical protein